MSIEAELEAEVEATAADGGNECGRGWTRGELREDFADEG